MAMMLLAEGCLVVCLVGGCLDVDSKEVLVC